MKKLVSIACLASALSFNTAVAEGRKVGNGGDAVVCGGTTELLDYYEGRVSLGHSNYDFGSGTTELEVANYLLSKLDRDLLRYVTHKERLDSFMSEVEFVQDALPDIKDYGHIFFPANCTVVQAAIQVDPATDPSGKRYIIHEPTWNAMDSQNKAGLILHELIYREALERRHTNSKRVRVANAFLASTSQASFSLESVVTAVSNQEVLEDGRSFYDGRQTWNTRLDIAETFYDELEARPEIYTYSQSELDSIILGEDIFAILDVITSKKEDKTYKYSFAASELKQAIEATDDILIKALLTGRLDVNDFSYKVGVIQLIGDSTESDLNKSLAAAYIIKTLYRIIDFSTYGVGGYEYDSRRTKNIIYKYAAPEDLRILVKTVLTKFELLTRENENSPFADHDSSIGSDVENVMGSLATVYKGMAGVFKDPLTLAITETIDQIDNLSKNQVTSLAYFLVSFRKFINLEKAHYDKVLSRMNDYLDIAGYNDWNVFWIFFENASKAYTKEEFQGVVKSCILHRQGVADTYALKSVREYCEHIIQENLAYESYKVSLSEDETRDYFQQLGKSVYFSGDKYLAGFEVVFFNLLTHNSLVAEIAYSFMNDIVSFSKSWGEPHIRVLGLLDQLDDNLISGIDYSFGKEESAMQIRIIKEVIGAQSSLNAKSIEFLNKVIASSYDQSVKLAATEVLNN